MLVKKIVSVFDEAHEWAEALALRCFCHVYKTLEQLVSVPNVSGCSASFPLKLHAADVVLARAKHWSDERTTCLRRIGIALFDKDLRQEQHNG